jgi:hypothetical protein
MMGRWSSDVYEIYCRMSLQAALQVGTALASASYDTFEGGFREEHLELQASELELVGGPAEEAGEDGEEEEAM